MAELNADAVVKREDCREGETTIAVRRPVEPGEDVPTR